MEIERNDAFWAGEFGDAYTDRNSDARQVAWRSALFARILSRTHGVRSVLELGANIGINLRAIRSLLPAAELHAVEINKLAYAELAKLPGIRATLGSLFEYRPEQHVDLVFTSGVLIHVAPHRLGDAYRALYNASRRYIAICEYYNPSPVDVPYHGESGRLFKRDFAGDQLDLFHDLRLVDYGFVYHRDPNFPADDVNWFLMEKC